MKHLAQFWVGTTLKSGSVFDRRQHLFIHKVTYIDHFKSPDMVVVRRHDLLRYKHLAYAFEEEIRFVVPQQGPGWHDNPEELRLPVENLNSLIRSVVVAPEAKPWFFDLVMGVTRKYGVTKPVRRSKLSFMPNKAFGGAFLRRKYLWECDQFANPPINYAV